VHKSQGSQIRRRRRHPPRTESPILTRELRNTAVTRAQAHLTVVGSEESVAAAISGPIARATGLRDRLWGERTA
jgi:exodeoxyribonuclease V alpha subunit